MGRHIANMLRPDLLLRPTPQGLYCPPGDFYIDPVRGPVPRAVITHGHADHARAGHGAVLATPDTLAIMAARFGAGFAATTQALGYGRTVTLNGVSVSLLPAGHILGSAQVVLDYRGLRMVASGDYKRRADPTCTPFEPARNVHVFITEATFALPVFHHPDTLGEVARLVDNLDAMPERTHLVGVYALGKAQRLIAELRAAGYERTIYLHGALERLCELYQARGVALGQLAPATLAPGERGVRERFRGELVLAPPSALSDRWAQRFPDPLPGFASGWMRVRQRARQRGVEVPLVISDHADWDELTTTLREIDAEDIWITYGREDALVRWAELDGRRARPLQLVGYDEEGD